MVYWSESKTYEVQVEGQTLGGSENARDGLATLISCYWIFNMQFYDTIKKSLLFMSFYLLGLNCIEVPPPVRKVANVIAGSNKIDN